MVVAQGLGDADRQASRHEKAIDTRPDWFEVIHLYGTKGGSDLAGLRLSFEAGPRWYPSRWVKVWTRLVRTGSQGAEQ